MPEPDRRRPSPRLIAAVAACVAIIALAGAWTIGPLAHALEPARLAAWAARLRDWPFAPLAAVGFFIVGNFFAAPSTVMIATTILLFGPLRGALYAYAGLLVSGSLIYAIGRFAARARVERWLARRSDPRLARFHDRVARLGFVAVALLRLTPVPFPLQNVVLGALRIGYGAFIVGTMLGILPIVLVLAGVAAQLEAWIATPDLAHAAWPIATCVVIAIAVWALVRHLAQRR